MSYDNMLPKWRILLCFPKDICQMFVSCLQIAICGGGIWVKGGGWLGDCVKSSKERDLPIQESDDDEMMTAMIRDVRGQHFSLRTGRDKARQLFWGGAGQWSKSTGQGKAAVVPFQGGAKTMWTNYKVSVFRSFWTNVYIFVILVSVFLGQGRAGRSSDENLTRLSRLFPWGGVGCAS